MWRTVKTSTLLAVFLEVRPIVMCATFWLAEHRLDGLMYLDHEIEPGLRLFVVSNLL